MSLPVLWLIAGPNGAGKTTLVTKLSQKLGLPPSCYINPDQITLTYLREQGVRTWKEAEPRMLEETFLRAARDAEIDLASRIDNGQEVVIETVLSTQKYKPLVAKVKQKGGVFNLVYICLNSPELSQRRVSFRFANGGHDVPTHKLSERWRKFLDLLPEFALQANSFWLFDNSAEADSGEPVLLASASDRTLKLHGVPSQLISPILSHFIHSFCRLDLQQQWKLDLGYPYPP